MNISRYTRDMLSKARKGGFRRKAPKKGKIRTTAQMDAYVSRFNQWVSDLKAAAAEYEREQRAKEVVKKFNATIGSLRQPVTRSTGGTKRRKKSATKKSSRKARRSAKRRK